MGIPSNLLVTENIDEEFICTICHDVLENPKIISNCEHVFCHTCINEWSINSNTCPVDREQIQDLVKPQRIFLNVLNRLKLRCQFENLGCKIVIERKNMVYELDLKHGKYILA